MTAEQLTLAIGDVFDRFDFVAAAITAYNPDSDTDGRMAATATRVLGELADRALGTG